MSIIPKSDHEFYETVEVEIVDIESVQVEVVGLVGRVEKERTELVTQKIESKLNLMMESQNLSRFEMNEAFRDIKKQNNNLLDLNKSLTKDLSKIADELEKIKIEKKLQLEKKLLRSKRKRLPKRDPMTLEIYKELMIAAEGPGYTKIRLRIACSLLAVTGVRVSELLSLKVIQLENLFKNNWIAISRSKRGPANHKAFLTAEGKKIIKDRQKDLEFMSLMKNSDSYIFTSELNPLKMLSRETLTRDINSLLRVVSQSRNDKPILSTHSFRIGFITKLWRDTKDIEFVKQAIGHQKLDTTSHYVAELSDEERRQRINNIY